jgi:Transposase
MLGIREWQRGKIRSCHPPPLNVGPCSAVRHDRRPGWRNVCPTTLPVGEQALRDRLRQVHPAFAQAVALAQGFAPLLRARQPERLEAWLQPAATRSLAALQHVAKRFQHDSAAVKAGVTLPWSSGPVEGHINRLKMLKRQMVGRARLDLLSHRFVLAPQKGQAQAPARRPNRSTLGLPPLASDRDNCPCLAPPANFAT